MPVLCALVTYVSPPPARADDGGDRVRASMNCEQGARVGRVRCDVEVRAEPGSSISWGDVVVLRVPPFAATLRGRSGPHEASVREPHLWRWTFAMVAREAGRGEVDVRVRIVLCGSEGCGPREVEVAEKLEVGP